MAGIAAAAAYRPDRPNGPPVLRTKRQLLGLASAGDALDETISRLASRNDLMSLT